jgi:hypothetical protein
MTAAEQKMMAEATSGQLMLELHPRVGLAKPEK